MSDTDEQQPQRASRERVALARAADKSWLALVPRRNLVRVALMLFILVVVIALRGRAGSIVGNLEAMFGAGQARPGERAREAPRVRLAPAPPAGDPGASR